jgi:hypothetical protein
MSDQRTPMVLFVDDDPDRLQGLRIELDDRGARTSALHPAELEDADLDDVTLVSVDQYLGATWDDYLLRLQELSLAAKPADGLAVAAAITSRLRARDQLSSVALHTADIGRLGAGIPASHREPLLAAQHDLDWVFRFDGAIEGDLAGRIYALSAAVENLPSTWAASSDDFGSEWLGLPKDASWGDLALQQIEDCRPPTHALSANTGGRAVVRWLAQRILPYPTFLIDAQHCAVSLGATLESFLISADRLRGTAYAGPLRGFLGDRWWRAGIQFDIASVDPEGDAVTSSELLSKFNEEFGTDLVPLSHDRPVIAYDANGRALPEPIEQRDGVRLQPDGWPVFADDAWATRAATTDDPLLRALVAHAERESLEES